jgi:hypothetical protein
MERELLSYYQTLLTEPPTDRSQAIDSILRNIPKEVTKEKNEALMRPITQEEVDQSLKATPLGKAPGPDDFTSDFFHYYWSIIREDVWEIIEDSRKSGKVLQALNATFLTLIPKENNSTSPSHFRPIALCNVIYKLLTKIIVTRLKPILSFLISPEQSGYVEGRQIMDSVILAHEVIHSLHSTKTQGMLLKLDLSKAFDKLSWSYLRSSLLAFGFDPTWVSWIVNLTSSTLFSILINGVPSKPFSPSRGIRQGDPLSPFLFILMAEGLSRTLKAAIRDHSLSGLTPHGISPPISHSQFVDDILLMGLSTAREALRFRAIIDLFCEASGMEVNLLKSQVFFFNTPLEIQNHLTLLLGFTHSVLPSVYLGIPLIDNPLRNSSWDSLLSSFKKRLSLWTFHSLNLPGRLILLKSVLQALPVYLFSALAAPTFILNTLRMLQRSFLWQGNKEGRKMSLVSWQKVCNPKKAGGLGLWDPTILNKVLSAKIWWRWLKRPQDLWARLWRKKYTPTIPETELIRWNGQSPGSLIWNAARNNRGLIMDHSFWELQSGTSAYFWSDSWQQIPPLNTDLTLSNLIPLTTDVGLHKVIDFWKPFDPGEIWRTWKTSHENLHIPPQLNLHPLQEHLAARKISSQQGEDILRWGHSTTRAFNIPEAYYIKAGHKTLPREEVWGKIWDMKTWPKISTFLWLVAHNNILTWDNLRKRGFIGPSWCQLCGQEEETQNHLLNLCPL